jgi:hypothetical protein
MAISFDSSWGITANASAASATVGPHSPSGSTTLIVVAIVTGGGSVTSVTDSQSNSYTVLGPIITPGAEKLFLAYSVPSTLGSITITGHYSPNTRSTLAAGSFLGTAASSPLDQSILTGTGTGTSLTSGTTGTTAFPNEVLIGYGANDNGSTGNTWTAGGSFAVITSNTTGSTSPPIVLEYQIVSSASTYTATATNANSAGWALGIATFADTPVVASGVVTAWIT